MSNLKITKKRIEAALLPLDKINAAASREKSIRHRHPSTLHLWWVRRPLAEALADNEFICSWHAIVDASSKVGQANNLNPAFNFREESCSKK